MYDTFRISDKLSCALKNYSHAASPERGSIRRVDAWAYGKKGTGGYEYKFNGSHVSAETYGPGWVEVGGYATSSGTLPWTYLFNAAFRPGNYHYAGTGRDERPNNSIDGYLSSFEHQLFASGHEMAHQNGITDEAEANWFGIYAVQIFRADDGAQCPK